MEAEPDRPAEGEVRGLRARAEATDRAQRFTQRMAAVEHGRRRRRSLRRAMRFVWTLVGAGVGVLVPIVVAAVVGGSDPAGSTLVLAAAVGALVAAVGPVTTQSIARRRGPAAWDAYRERYVLFGEPAARVHDADRPKQQPGGPPPPPPRR